MRTTSVKTNSPAAFTLVELLVVVAIIGILIGMLLPAVQQVREAARRASCLNNIRQLALSAHLFHDSKNRFPPSAVGGEDETIGFGPARGGYITWPAFLLPFLEQDNLANKIDFNYSAYVSDSTGQHETLVGEHPANVSDQVNKFASTNAPVLFSCPSVAKQFEEGEHKDYAINVGGQLPWYPFNRDGNGIGFLDSRIGIEKVRDGTSNTFLLLERKRYDGRDLSDNTRVNPFLWSSFKHNGQVLYGYNADESEIIATFRIGKHWRAPSSDHPEGVNVAMCDGSTRFLSDSVTFVPYRATFTRSGGEVEVVQFDD